MDFWVLGPLRVDEGGDPFALGGPKQRTLLALLIAAAGRPVSTNSLLMGVYGPDASPGARRSLQTYISTLRRELGDAVRREGDGYVLSVDPSTIDAVRFEGALDRARRIADEGVAGELLREGLALWRGSPYGDVELSDVLRAEISRLRELKAQALEARVELDLVAGRHRELVSELEEIIREYPLREELRAHQMVALYRNGRQADALAAYRRLEDELREELGLDPNSSHYSNLLLFPRGRSRWA